MYKRCRLYDLMIKEAVIGGTSKVKRVKSLCLINLLKTKRRLLYLKTCSVPRSKHFPLQL